MSAYRTTITLTEDDLKLLAEFKERLGLSTSGAVSAALQISETIIDGQDSGGKFKYEDVDGKEEVWKYVTPKRGKKTEIHSKDREKESNNSSEKELNAENSI